MIGTISIGQKSMMHKNPQTVVRLSPKQRKALEKMADKLVENLSDTMKTAFRELGERLRIPFPKDRE